MNYEIGIATFTASSAITHGQVCVLDENKKLAPLASASDATNNALFIASIDASAGELVSAKIVGACTGTVVVKATAGDVTPGAAIFTADDGKVAVSGSRQIGVYIGDAKTLTDGDEIQIAPVFTATSA